VNGGGRPGVDGFALDHFCREKCPGPDLCKRHAQANLAVCDAHSVCCHLLPRASAKGPSGPDSEPGTVC
jgi:hypothetical protein